MQSKATCELRMQSQMQGFPQVLGTWGGGGGWTLQNLMREGEFKSIHGRGAWGQLKMLSKNTCEGVHLIVKLPAISLQVCKFTKMNFFTHIFQGF